MRKIYKTLKAAAENPESVVNHGKLYAEAAEAYKSLFKEMNDAKDKYYVQSDLTTRLKNETRRVSEQYVKELEWQSEIIDFKPYKEGYMWGSDRHKRLISQLQRIATIASKTACCEPGMSEAFETASGYLRRLFDLNNRVDEDGYSTWPDEIWDWTEISHPYWVDHVKTHV